MAATRCLPILDPRALEPEHTPQQMEAEEEQEPLWGEPEPPWEIEPQQMEAEEQEPLWGEPEPQAPAQAQAQPQPQQMEVEEKKELLWGEPEPPWEIEPQQMEAEEEHPNPHGR